MSTRNILTYITAETFPHYCKATLQDHEACSKKKNPSFLFCCYFAVKAMIFAGLITRTLKQNPAICGKMNKDKEIQNAEPQARGKNSLLKEKKGMFRHRIESLPGNRPNMKKKRKLEFW